MRLIAGGGFLMGQDGDPSTAPKHEITLPDFYVDLQEVTNARFARFVEQSGFKEPLIRQRLDKVVKARIGQDRIYKVSIRAMERLDLK